MRVNSGVFSPSLRINYFTESTPVISLNITSNSSGCMYRLIMPFDSVLQATHTVVILSDFKRFYCFGIGIPKKCLIDFFFCFDIFGSFKNLLLLPGLKVVLDL
jgi:hypothetical protein